MGRTCLSCLVAPERGMDLREILCQDGFATTRSRTNSLSPGGSTLVSVEPQGRGVCVGCGIMRGFNSKRSAS
ncbi:hypothetical protein PSEUDO9AG_50459 [Pseudomonas sp. 9Ag]|nr:hypothetical protein PSEUDO9AG_50459 [Pseudomonas sp. 9Ag]